jgi:cytochrome c oxidase cbb3-type subunit 1
MKIPVGIPIFVAAAGIDPRYARIVHRYLLSSVVWLLLGTSVALLASFKLNYPTILEVEWLSWGRLRPIHVQTSLWGWLSLAALGLAFYVVPRSSKTNLHSLGAARASLWLWNVGIAGGVVALATGQTSGNEYREYPIWVVAPIAASLALTAWNFYKTIAARRVSQIYISNWFILLATVWTMIIVAVGWAPVFRRGIGQVTVQGWYMHNVIGMWFTPLAVGLTYYALPKLLNKPIYSYALGVLGFWTHLVFYTVIGVHHFIFTPVPMWLQTTAIIFSVAMMVPVWASVGNFLLTMWGEWNALRVSYSLPFVLIGVIGYGLSSAQGTSMSFKAANEAWHLTHFTVGHSHLAMVGFVSFLVWGATYGLLPRVTGREPNVNLVGVHFWLSFAGLVVMLLALSIGGHAQGASWNAGRPFVEGLREVAPALVWRSVAGTFMVIGHVVFALNLWMMRPGAFVNLMAPPEAPPEPQPA